MNNLNKSNARKSILHISYLTLSSPNVNWVIYLSHLEWFILHQTVITPNAGCQPPVDTGYNTHCLMSNFIQAFLLQFKLQILIPQDITTATQFDKHLLSLYVIICVRYIDTAFAQGLVPTLVGEMRSQKYKQEEEATNLAWEIQRRHLKGFLKNERECLEWLNHNRPWKYRVILYSKKNWGINKWWQAVNILNTKNLIPQEKRNQSSF